MRWNAAVLAWAAVAACALPSLAAAQAADEPAAPPAWNLGAGLTLFSTGIVTTIATPFGSTTPLVAASIERRLGGSTWLVLGASGEIGRSTNEREGLEAKTETRAIALELGFRRELTAPRAPVAVSLVLLADVGWADAEQSASGDAAQPPLRTDGRRVGGSLGLAVERELTAGLAVRIASPLAAASWSRSTIDERRDANGVLLTPGMRSTSVDAGFQLAPRLELRLAF